MPERSNMQQRIITGTILGAVVIGMILGGYITSTLLIIIIALMSGRELFQLVVSRTRPLESWAFSLMLTAPVVLGYFYPLSPGVADNVFWDWISLISILIFLGGYALLSISQTPSHFFNRLKGYALGVFLVTVPALFATVLADITPMFLLGIFILLWTSDVFAFLIGSRYGKTKLAPDISPGKTWEGTLGAVVITLATAFILSQWIDMFGWRDWLVNAAIVVVFGTLGDLTISAIKRIAQVKDSGTLLPGHGGFLDRFDSFLGCLTWVGIYNILI